MSKKKPDYRKIANKYFKNPSEHLPLKVNGIDFCKKCKRVIEYCICNKKEEKK